MAPATVDAATSSGMAPLDTGDMQGLVGRAYGHLRFARYHLLGINDPVAAGAWLGTIADDVTTAAHHGEDLTGPCINVAFTGTGLRQLGLASEDFASLPRPLQEGIVTDHRSRILGDSGASAPTTWRWGGPSNEKVDLVLMIFAASEDELDSACASWRSAFEAGGALSDVGEPIDGRVLNDQGSEHFGFADGLSQPVLKGWPHGRSSQRPPAEPQPPKWAEINPGEVVLGYHDNFDKPSEGPTVAAATDPTNLLPPAFWGASGRHHLGHNGSFLVLRQLAQDVVGFRRFVQSSAALGASGGASASPDEVSPKLVGRWPNGAPVVLAPTRDDQAAPGANDFGYHDLDQDGLRCPIGAHIRRSNPRDSSADNPAKALASTKNHRILRRGRPYGLPIVSPPSRPGEEATAERGLVFICLNADIERQFEFVQHTWLDNPFFAGLYGEVDPLIGSRPPAGGTFTQPADPIRRKISGMPSFVTVKGGGYFFLPGIRALRYLAGLNR
jgi:Dyp-type peroxidase family